MGYLPVATCSHIASMKEELVGEWAQHLESRKGTEDEEPDTKVV